MRVLQITPKYFPSMGGVETVVKKISETLVENGIEVTVYSVDLNRRLSRQERINQVSVKRFQPVIDDPLFLPEPNFMFDLMREKAEIIHVHNFHTLLPFLAALTKKAKQKMLLQPHYHRFGQSPFRHSMFQLYKTALKSIVLPRADLAIANSHYEERALQEDFPQFKSIKLLPEGMDANDERRVKRHPEPNRILYVGVLKRYKNVDKVLEGFSFFLRRGSAGSKLIIVGDGPENKFLLAYARGLGLGTFVEWKHDLSREQLLDEYARASAFIMLSQLESFSRVVYDALLMGVPAVVLNFGALKDLVSKGLVIGVNSLSPKEIAQGLSKALSRNPPRFSNDDLVFLDWPEYSKRILSIYYGMLEDRKI